MKLNTTIRALFVGAALSASSLLANTVTISYPSPKFDGNPGLDGGEFLAVTDNDGSFLTFCLEHDVPISLNTPYNYSISGSVVLNEGDPISKGTAWLYSAFIHGSLSGPSGNGTYEGGSNAIHDVNAGLLQTAFWMLEDEIAYDSANYYVALVESIFGANVQANYTGSSVKVVNIWSGRGTDKQDVLTSVPDAGMTAALLGLGLLSLAAFRRKY
jgi:hypothetical protein